MDENESAELVARWQTGDEQAADALFRRYAERLIALARTRLSEKLARRLDPEDVVQSAYRSFFAGARAGRYALEQSGDLWRLLVAITLHKLHHQVERHTSAKRAVYREQNVPNAGSIGSIPVAALAAEPSPAEAVALADELEQVMRALNSQQRQVLERRLHGATLDEIAAALQCSQRTVRRVMNQIREYLDSYYREHCQP
jgi:RNA polymerase sigma-70 factor (ECF subfamily)